MNPVVVMPAPVGSYSRVALLQDVNPQNVGVFVLESIDTQHNNERFEWFAMTNLTPTINQCYPYANTACDQMVTVWSNGQAQSQAQTMTISRTYASARGIYAVSNDGTPGVNDDATLLNNGTASPMPQIAPTASQVNF